MPIEDADYMVIEALLDDVLDAELVRDAVEEALRILARKRADQLEPIHAELAAVEKQRQRLVNATAAGGELEGLLSALRAREARRQEVEALLVAARDPGALGSQTWPRCGLSSGP